MNHHKLLTRQLEEKLKPYYSARNAEPPPLGWIHALRTSLGITLEQLAKKLKITRQSVKSLESREVSGSVTIATLREAGRAMRMKLVYGFVPEDGSIQNMIENRAKQLAIEIVMRTSANMTLEEQGNSAERIKQAIEERTKEIMDEMPKILWD